MSILRLYKILLKRYGPQGWWPLFSTSKNRSQYRGVLPSDNKQFFEIAAGALLTQNVSWKNAEKALAALKKEGLLNAKLIAAAPDEIIAELIRPSGYFNQKTIKLKNFSSWFISRGGSFSKLLRIPPEDLRNDLLAVKGIGPETADSILLYGLNMKFFVVDAYLIRLFARLNLLTEGSSYEQAQALVHGNFRADKHDYRELHALIVAHAVNACRKTPLCSGCPLTKFCLYPQKKFLP